MNHDLEISGLYLFLTFFLVFLNGFFVAAEFALVRVRGSQIELKVKTGSRVARLTRSIIANLSGYLAATQLGITIASLGLGVIGEGVFTDLMIKIFYTFGLEIHSPIVINICRIIAFVFITVLSIVFGELAPKRIAIQGSVRTALAISAPLRIFYVMFKPIIWALNNFANFILRMLGISAVQGIESHHSS